jgi:eukaryotic-like serine/threonine-protein kinase
MDFSERPTAVLPATLPTDAHATAIDPEPAAGAPAATLSAGERVGAYEIEAPLASGGFGVVYRARDAGGGAAAIKVLRAELATTERTLARFEREVDAVARIEHPNVVQVLGRGRLADGRPYFAMELIEGQDLASHLRARGALPVAEAQRLLAPICEALAAAHDRGIIHRDVKASNVMLALDGRVVLLDFGVAKVLDPAVPGLTRSRQIVGTPPCMAPEQLAGRAANRRTDVYALGVLAYHMLTGAPPFADESPVMLQHLHRHARRPRPSAAIELPPSVDRAVVSAMAVDPSERPGDARAFYTALAGAPPDALGGAEAGVISVRVEVSPIRPDAPAGELLDELERVITTAERHLVRAGFTPALSASRTLLYTRPRGATDHDADTIADELRATASDLVSLTAVVDAST